MTSFEAADSAEIPEADRLEQDLPVDEENEELVGESGADSSLEVNEADAAEQSRAVPEEEEYPRG